MSAAPGPGDGPSSPGLVLRRRLDAESRRRAILDAAAARFTTGPYAQVSVAGVAATVGVSEGLVFRYFPTKAELYTAVVRASIDALVDAQTAADATLPAGVPTRDRIRSAVEVLLDHVQAHRSGWAAPHVAGPDDPASTLDLRREARRTHVGHLAALLGTTGWARHEYAVWGYLGFLDAACQRWAERGCPPDERWAIVDGALGALEGALGDWGS